MRFIGSVVAFASITTAFTPAYPYEAYNSTKNSTTIIKVPNNVTPNKASSAPIVLKSTPAPPKVCDVHTVTVYETAYGAKANPSATRLVGGYNANPSVKASPVKASGSPKSSPTAKVGKPFGYNEEQFRKTEGDMKLKACNHWTHDAKDPKNLVPTSVGDKTQLYYAENGKPQPSKTFYFGVIDLLFKAPAVVLEQSAYISNTVYSGNQLTIDFTSAVACDFAQGSWAKGTIIVSSSAGCKKSSDDDQCYFEIDDLVKSDDGKSIIVKGTPQSQSDCTEGGKATWGMYRPSVGNGGSTVTQPGKNGTAGWNTPGSNGTTGTGGSTGSGSNSGSGGVSVGGNNSTIGGGFPGMNSTSNGTKFGDDMSTCVAPVDTKYNLPTACIGEYFDLDLDEALGYGELSPDDVAFIKQAMGGMDDDVLAKVTRRAVLHRRVIERRFLGRFLRFVAKKIIAPAVAVLKTAVNVAVTVVKGAVQLITTGTISGSIRESFSFNLPNGAKAEAKQVESPWGTAILIAAYGTSPPQGEPNNGLQKDGYLNIYCVGCGAQGRVELAGSATWSVTQGITEGKLEAWADIKAALKIGVDAQIQMSKEWNKNLFQIGLPGLSFGVITIGPQVRLDSRVTLEAQAKGRLLAGAELSWNRAYAKVDIVTPSNSIRQNFDPVFHPTFEAEGSIFVGAELGLPIGLHFGISIASWRKTVALINEPMIKGIAKAAAQASLANGQFTAGFTATEGCIGIHTNLSWRNRLYGDVLGSQYSILDTGYKSIKSACIAIGRQNQSPAVGGGSTTGGSATGGSATGGSTTNPSTPSQTNTLPSDPSNPADDDDEPSTPKIPTGGNTTPPTPQPSADDDTTPKTGDDTPNTQQPSANTGSLPSGPASDNTQSNTAEPAANTNNGQGSPAPVPSTDDDAPAGKRSLANRQSNSTVPASNTTTPAGLRELTNSIKKATDVVTYPMADVATVAYAREDGYEFTKVLAEEGEYNLVYCSNGNMYVKKSTQATGLGCDELFVYSDNAVAGDGAGRYLYYHTNTMSAAGVSRLRLGDDEHPVIGTSALALVAWNAAEVETEFNADIEGLYFAADYDTQAFYWLTFCSYKDGQAPKVFIVEDVEKGIAVLESGDVKYSVTGGNVDKCFALSAKEDGASMDKWAEWDDSENTTPDGLEFDEE
ncbi:hypothetical protein DE146DRAFT_286217 [Phaeosphaeria sp. MPI-PUGE-AT-0046c]|nr:hypothetical protein DE146DRAFT_286217 [Phaeosphaeria sp. MPI-PUGE-AT-0046c]